MQPIVNLEETPGKVVGRRTAAAADYDRLAEAGKELFRGIGIPKGVYRFRTHEEADQWMENQILQAALRKARAPQSGTT
jgi:hypothetical protein